MPWQLTLPTLWFAMLVLAGLMRYADVKLKRWAWALDAIDTAKDVAWIEEMKSLEIVDTDEKPLYTGLRPPNEGETVRNEWCPMRVDQTIPSSGGREPREIEALIAIAGIAIEKHNADWHREINYEVTLGIAIDEYLQEFVK